MRVSEVHGSPGPGTRRDGAQGDQATHHAAYHLIDLFSGDSSLVETLTALIDTYKATPADTSAKKHHLTWQRMLSIR
jgi:hypothetical protein